MLTYLYMKVYAFSKFKLRVKLVKICLKQNSLQQLSTLGAKLNFLTCIYREPIRGNKNGDRQISVLHLVTFDLGCRRQGFGLLHSLLEQRLLLAILLFHVATIGNLRRGRGGQL